MKKIMKVETNASTMFVTYDTDEKIVRILDNDETNSGARLSDVEDDSSWEIFENVDNFNEWLGVDYNNPDAPKVIEEIEA